MNEIAISGPMGSGKTTIGRTISEQTGASFRDLDVYITGNLLPEGKKSIGEIVSGEGGMDAFRPIEMVGLRELLRQKIDIISLGGGAVTIGENVDMLREDGRKVVLLYPPFEECWRRIKKDETGNNMRAELDEEMFAGLYADREIIYRSTADIIIETVGSVDQIVAEILSKIKSD